MRPKVNKSRVQQCVLGNVLLAVLLCATVSGQADNKDPFSAVPAPLRTRLVERLKLLVEYQRSQQWEKEYDLLSILVTQGESKADHFKRLQRSSAEGFDTELIDFVPKSVTYQGGGPSDVVAFGCAKVRQKTNVVELYASVEAYREREDWYFSPVGIISPIGGQPEPCPYSNKDRSYRLFRASTQSLKPIGTQ